MQEGGSRKTGSTFRHSGRHAVLKELFTQSDDKEQLVPKTKILIHYTQTVANSRTPELEYFFGRDVLLREGDSSRSVPSSRDPERDNMLGNTKAGAFAINKGLLADFRDHWDWFSVLEKQQILMSFMQIFPEKLKSLGKEGRDIIFDIIHNKAEMDEDRWVVTLSRVMRNFPRSNSIRANAADRESHYFLNKQVDKGLAAGFQAATSSTSGPSSRLESTACDDSNNQSNGAGALAQQSAAGKTRRIKTDINDSIPPMGSHCVTCWPLARHGHPPNYAVPDGVAEKLLKPIRDAAREEIEKNYVGSGYRPVCDYTKEDRISMGLWTGLDLHLPPKVFLEDLQNEFRHKVPRAYLSDESPWQNEVIHRNGEWQAKAQDHLDAHTLTHGFERTTNMPSSFPRKTKDPFGRGHALAAPHPLSSPETGGAGKRGFVDGASRSMRVEPTPEARARERSRSRDHVIEGRQRRKERSPSRDRVKEERSEMTPAKLVAEGAPRPQRPAPCPEASVVTSMLGARIILEEMRFRPEQVGKVGKVLGQTQKGKLRVKLDGETELVSVWQDQMDLLTDAVS